MFKATILCSRCDRIIKVAGVVWGHRLRFPYAKKNNKGDYLGWNCDRCADAIEMGLDY